ncbi:hypothetical protein [Portibacter lacus]|uniref:DUF4890 domain-containing protein n=1 Tax=Portibacter lacus TaxID=1099794 RepID=A0AA37SLK3_9BACT|nr:hypothetical protein [Portibacter lacus]GLR15799.1 hypothetical protein GCM10007940_04140 [Portibacter lacus]
MKNLILMMFLGLVTFQVQAQGQGQGERRVERPSELESAAYIAMVDSMSLDAEQKIQFDAVQVMYQDKLKKMMTEAREKGVEREEIREVMQGLNKEQDGVLKNLLTESQYKIYTEYKAERQKNRGSRRGNRGGGGGRG